MKVFEGLREAFFKKFPYNLFLYNFLSDVNTFSCLNSCKPPFVALLHFKFEVTGMGKKAFLFSCISR